MQVSSGNNFHYRFGGFDDRRQQSDSGSDNPAMPQVAHNTGSDEYFGDDFLSSLEPTPTSQENILLEEDGAYQIRPSSAHSAFGAAVAKVIVARW
ncbi:hypothetical protein JJB09_23235 [Rhizobium sp. KVB221]|uniref:Uncharacterized protein n=1 Tax=Rhizobium setariae TaxID=2801340 RepID=A0A937CPH8_9HYPH|nr:hypothetical protein [Rhizobium setariae]MBL0374931.1 hypothetical protein [Rhizobium setariae]